MNISSRYLVVGALVLGACEGSEGVAGPPGDPGEQGEQGEQGDPGEQGSTVVVEYEIR